MAYLIPNSPISNEPMTVIDFMLENENNSVFVRYQKQNSDGMWVRFLNLSSILESKSQHLKTGIKTPILILFKVDNFYGNSRSFITFSISIK